MRAIDADALKEDLTRFYDNEVTARKLIDEQPTIQPEPHWIPCGKCIHADGKHRRCEILGRSINEDYFCYWAEPFKGVAE